MALNLFFFNIAFTKTGRYERKIRPRIIYFAYLIEPVNKTSAKSLLITFVCWSLYLSDNRILEYSSWNILNVPYFRGSIHLAQIVDRERLSVEIRVEKWFYASKNEVSGAHSIEVRLSLSQDYVAKEGIVGRGSTANSENPTIFCNHWHNTQLNI